MQIFEPLLDTFFPKFCLSCGKESAYVCPNCFAKIPIQARFLCYVCGKRSPDGKTCKNCSSKLTGLLVASDWKNLLVRQMIYEYKYRFVKNLSGPIAEILIRFLEINRLIGLPSNKLILIPVPLHKRRLSWRGFNQSELLCDEMEDFLKIPATKNLLIRRRNTSPQMEIADKQKRQSNVKNAFVADAARKKEIKDKIVFLVDDVCTTGATLNECAAALRPLRPKTIWGLVVAKH